MFRLFIKHCVKHQSLTLLALHLLIFTGVRANALRHMRKDQIDADIWIIPAENMKGRRNVPIEFRVPLSIEALEIKKARLLSRNDFFFSATGRGPLSDKTIFPLCFCIFLKHFVLLYIKQWRPRRIGSIIGCGELSFIASRNVNGIDFGSHTGVFAKEHQHTSIRRPSGTFIMKPCG
ncbi:phage integrase [Bartonella tribocorum]|nr:phage integrase [Bartonella tribocorum]